jgi:phenylacetate-CoA ligase
MAYLGSLYNYVPASLQEIANYAYSFLPLRIKRGNGFFKQLKLLEQSQWWSENELKNYQNEKLRSLIRHAYENVPYYRRLFEECKLTPRDINTIKDLPKIPLLTKDIVREHYQDLVATNIKRKNLIRLSTSGTTGKPLIFYTEKRLEFFNFDPYKWRMYRWAGQEFGDLKVLLSSWIIKPDKNGKKRIVEYSPARNLLIFSAYDINRENVPLFAEALRKYRPRFIEAFPASLEALIKFFIEIGIQSPIKPKAIFTNSEVLYPWQRELFIEYFGCQILDAYGLEERVINSGQCGKGLYYHVSSEYGVTEFVDSRRPVDNSNRGEIIATSLNNYGMPFIRYNTEDLGCRIHENCTCGRGLPLIGLAGGRKRNFAISKNGSMISLTIIDIPNVTENVRQFQFEQSEQGALTLKIIKKDSFTEKDLEKIESKLKEKFSDDLKIQIVFVDNINKPKYAAKWPLLIQNLKI